MNKVRLKPGKEKPILNRHHWIFSGAVEKFPPFEPGEILGVESHKGEPLGFAYFNKGSLAGRMLSFGPPPLEAIEKAIVDAIALRRALFDADTTAYRLVNGEGDLLPGLIVDKYADILVIQSATAGMDRLIPFIVTILERELAPAALLEKSVSSSRKEEGLAPKQAVLKGVVDQPVLILENGLKFYVDPLKGQKTGFFLDQREMRAYVGTLKKKKVLNCFSYTGGFSVYALAGGASSVDSVDISKESLELAKANCVLNGFSRASIIEADVFDFLRKKELDYDLVILDPPAFAKKAKDVVMACRGYKEINRWAIQKMAPGSTLITCSCSYFVDEKLFQQVVFQAAAEAKKNVRILGKHRQATDHPINLFHPEGSYLKSLILSL